jgi:hypothetical protein
VSPGNDPRRRRVLLIAGLALILVGAGLIAGAGWTKYRRARTCLDSALARLDALQALVPAGSPQAPSPDVGGMGAELRGLQGDLACLRAEGREAVAVAPLLGWLPEVGDDAASAPDLLEMAQAMVDAGVLLADGLSPLLEAMEAREAAASGSAGSSLDLPGVVRALEAAQPELASAAAKLDRAWELQLELQGRDLLPRVERMLDLTGRTLPLLRSGMGAAQLAPALLGARGPRTYLILAQNDDERRPTGGWISGLGLVTVEGGRAAELSFTDSWTVDNLQVPHEVPPDSMLRALWAEIWLFRDANWSPDFPASAQRAEEILRRDQGIAVDGVLAVDQQALQWLVGALAPLHVASSDEPVDASNLLSFVREAWAEPQSGVTLEGGWGEWVARRKDFMSELAAAMLHRVQDQPETVNLSRLAQALWQGLQERHILVYLHDGDAAELLAAQRWDGAIVEAAGDYFQVVDANVGFNKVDPNVRREITYRVDLSDPEQGRAEATVSYRNESSRAVEACVQEVESLPDYEQRMHGCFWNYARVYTRQGARLEPVEREPLPPGSLLDRYRFAPPGDAGPDSGPVEKGKVPYGLFFVLLPGEGREVRLAWALPAGAVVQEGEGWRYRLLVQKQSGTPAIPLRVEVTLPPGARIVLVSPEPVEVAGGVAIFSLSLATDQEIDITFAPAE